MLSISIKNKIKKTLLISGSSALLMAGLLPNATTSVQAAAPEIKANASMTVDFYLHNQRYNVVWEHVDVTDENNN